MKKEKTNKGITLIALIITIVVMLILVAVTLSIALGENGVVSNAKRAARDTNSAMTNDTNIADEVTYGGVQGIDNIVDYLTNRIETRKLKIGDTVRVKVAKKASNKVEDITIYTGIKFDNNTEIHLQTANSSVDKNYAQIVRTQNGNIVISEDEPAYLYLMEGTTIMGRTIETEGWYKFTNMVSPDTAELVTEVPGFEATIEAYLYSGGPISLEGEEIGGAPDCEIYDFYIEFYK